MDVMEIHRLAVEYADASARRAADMFSAQPDVWTLRVAEQQVAYQRLLDALIEAGLDVNALVAS